MPAIIYVNLCERGRKPCCSKCDIILSVRPRTQTSQGQRPVAQRGANLLLNEEGKAYVAQKLPSQFSQRIAPRIWEKQDDETR